MLFSDFYYFYFYIGSVFHVPFYYLPFFWEWDILHFSKISLYFFHKSHVLEYSGWFIWCWHSSSIWPDSLWPHSPLVGWLLQLFLWCPNTSYNCLLISFNWVSMVIIDTCFLKADAISTVVAKDKCLLLMNPLEVSQEKRY